jgi:predicted ester cyclase/ketosteroid isomerase-like protein
MTQTPTREAEVLRAHEAWMAAAFRRDVNACSPFMADEFTMHARGGVVTKAQWMEHLLSSVDLEPVRFSEQEAVVYGDAAMMTQRSVRHYTLDGREYLTESLLTDVWVWRDGRWQVVRRTRAPVPPTPPADTNKEIVRRLIEEVWNGGDLALTDALCEPALSERHRAWVKRFATAFPDAHSTIDLLLAEGDWVVALLTRTGTHTGVASGMYVDQVMPDGVIPPTCRPVTLTGAFICRIHDGRIAEIRALGDRLALFQQLGVIPDARPATPRNVPV